MQFNIRLKNLRQMHHMTQNELADVLGLKPSTIANYESNRNEPSFDKLIAIAAHFNVSIDYLLGITEDCHNCVYKNFDKDKLDTIYLFSKLSSSSMNQLNEYLEFLLHKQRYKRTSEH